MGKILPEDVNSIASYLKVTLSPNEFALIVFDTDKEGILAYSSNAAPENMVRILRETADKLEKAGENPPASGQGTE